MKKKNDLLWSLSLMVIGIVTFILASSHIVGTELPDVAVRVLGIIDLIAIPFLALWSFGYPVFDYRSFIRNI